MSTRAEIQEAMKSVAQAYQIVGRFHQNVADLFRSIVADMESRDVAYGVYGEGEILTSDVDTELRRAKSWCIKHLALPLQPLDEEDAPLLLIHVAVDKSFSETPEVWLGVLSKLESHEGDSFPFEDTLSYFFEDYFGPEEDWDTPNKWYTEDFEDEVASGVMSFLRLPLDALVDRAAVKGEICDRLDERVQALLELAD